MTMSVIGDLLFTGVAVVFASFGVGLFKFGRMMTVPVRATEAEEPTPIGEVSQGDTVEVNGEACLRSFCGSSCRKR